MHTTFCPLSSAKCISGSSVCTFRDTINRSINSQVWDRRPTATNDDHHRGRFVDSWEFVSAPPVSSLHLHISREYLLRLRNSGIRRANHRHVPTIHENIGPGADVYFAARWKTPGIRPINLRSWNWFAGFNHRELFLTGVALSFPRLVSSRLVSSRFLLGLARDHPLRILGIFLAPLCREFDVASRQRAIVTERIFTRCVRGVIGASNAFFRKTVDRPEF